MKLVLLVLLTIISMNSIAKVVKIDPAKFNVKFEVIGKYHKKDKDYPYFIYKIYLNKLMRGKFIVAEKLIMTDVKATIQDAQIAGDGITIDFGGLAKHGSYETRLHGVSSGEVTQLFLTKYVKQIKLLAVGAGGGKAIAELTAKLKACEAKQGITPIKSIERELMDNIYLYMKEKQKEAENKAPPSRQVVEPPTL